MTMISTIASARCEALVDALRAEFGSVLAERIFEAEAADFLWEARAQERYLGQQIDVIDDDEPRLEEVSRVAFLSNLNGRWWAGIGLVDGQGSVTDLLWKLPFDSRSRAELEYLKAR